MGAMLQTWAALVLLLLFLAIFLISQPYEEKYLNNLEQSALGTNVITLLLGLGLYTNNRPGIDKSESLNILITFAIVCLNILFAIYVLYTYLMYSQYNCALCKKHGLCKNNDVAPTVVVPSGTDALSGTNNDVAINIRSRGGGGGVTVKQKKSYRTAKAEEIQKTHQMHRHMAIQHIEEEQKKRRISLKLRVQARAKDNEQQRIINNEQSTIKNNEQQRITSIKHLRLHSRIQRVQKLQQIRRKSKKSENGSVKRPHRSAGKLQRYPKSSGKNKQTTKSAGKQVNENAIEVPHRSAGTLQRYQKPATNKNQTRKNIEKQVNENERRTRLQQHGLADKLQRNQIPDKYVQLDKTKIIKTIKKNTTVQIEPAVAIEKIDTPTIQQDSGDSGGTDSNALSIEQNELTLIEVKQIMIKMLKNQKKTKLLCKRVTGTKKSDDVICVSQHDFQMLIVLCVKHATQREDIVRLDPSNEISLELWYEVLKCSDNVSSGSSNNTSVRSDQIWNWLKS